MLTRSHKVLTSERAGPVGCSHVPEPHAVVAETLQLDQLELPQRKLSVGQRRPAPDQRGRNAQHELVEQVCRQQLAGEVAAADQPRSLEPARADQSHELGEVTRELLEWLGSGERRERLGVRDDPGRLAAVRPRAVADHEVPGPRTHDQRVDPGVEARVVAALRPARQRPQEREVVVRPGDPPVEAHCGVVDDHSRNTISEMNELEKLLATRSDARVAVIGARRGRLEVHRGDGEEPRERVRPCRARGGDPLLRRSGRPLRQARRDRAARGPGRDRGALARVDPGRAPQRARGGAGTAAALVAACAGGGAARPRRASRAPWRRARSR